MKQEYEQTQALWEQLAREMLDAGHPMAGFAMERANANKLFAMEAEQFTNQGKEV